jgi:site-specific recombinase XerC
VMRTAGTGPDRVRLRALVVVLWRAGLRIGEALGLAETDLDARRGAVLVRHGKGDKRREVGMDSWAWEHLEPWQQLRVRFPVGPLFCVIHGPTAGRNWAPASARRQLGRTAAAAGVRRRFAPHHYADMVVMPMSMRKLCTLGCWWRGGRHNACNVGHPFPIGIGRRRSGWPGRRAG